MSRETHFSHPNPITIIYIYTHAQRLRKTFSRFLPLLFLFNGVTCFQLLNHASKTLTLPKFPNWDIAIIFILHTYLNLSYSTPAILALRLMSQCPLHCLTTVAYQSQSPTMTRTSSVGCEYVSAESARKTAIDLTTT